MKKINVIQYMVGSRNERVKIVLSELTVCLLHTQLHFFF